MKHKFNWGQVFFESCMIIVSVLLALFINEWKHRYNEREETAIMLNNIVDEIEANKAFIEEVIDYHNAVLANINNSISGDSLQNTFFSKGYFEIYKVAPKGVMQGDLHNIAWIVAKEQHISNRIQLQNAQMLHSVYEQQSTVNETINRIIKILFEREIHRQDLLTESVITLGIEFNEVASQEKELHFLYQKALQQLKNR
jgi:hypothetical protein